MIKMRHIKCTVYSTSKCAPHLCAGIIFNILWLSWKQYISSTEKCMLKLALHFGTYFIVVHSIFNKL
jgi:hypothetical protein